MQKGTSLMRNNLLKYTGAMLLLLACCLTSCIKEDYAVADKASVTLTFTTRANGTTDSNLEAGEGMKHLRVLVVDQATSEIRFNYEREFQADEISATVTFGDLYAGHTYDFYAIANEESFGGDFSGTPDLKQLYKTLLNQEAGTLINVSDGKHLPAAAKCSLKITGNGNQQLEIEMQRVVAKARVNFINQTGTAQQITGIRLVKVGAANTYLFPTSYDMNYTPNDNGSVDLALGDVTVSAPMDATASTALGYFYESTAPEGGYALQATWNGEPKTFPLTEMGGGNGLSQILRNAFINITLTLKQNDWKLEYEVLEWEDISEINIDFTDVLSYTSYGWQRDTYLDLLPNNTVWMNPDEEAVLSFAIEAPSGTLWRAALEGDVNAFQFVGASSGSAYTEDSNTPVTQSIRVKVTDPESNERHEVTLRVYADIGGKTYELDLTDPDTQKEPGGVINRFTLLQSR